MSDKVLKRSLIRSAAAGDETALLTLDKMGLLPGPGDDAQTFGKSLTALADALEQLDEELKNRPCWRSPAA